MVPPCGARAATVWIDTDISIGSPIREVDDAYALVLAFHSPSLRITGLSTTYGNAPLGHTTLAARDLVQRFGRSPGLNPSQVFSGAASARDLGRRSDASDALTAALEKESVTYVALGPLTNLATFLKLHPRLAPKIERVIFLGGQAEGSSLAFGPTRSFRIHDANVFKDPAAAAVLLRSKIPLMLVPIAVASDLVIDASDLRQLEQSGGAGSYLSVRSRIWLWFWTKIVKTKGGPIFDALAITSALKPEMLSLGKRYAKMDERGDLIVTARQAKGARRIQFCTAFAPKTKRFVLERLMSR